MQRDSILWLVCFGVIGLAAVGPSLSERSEVRATPPPASTPATYTTTTTTTPMPAGSPVTVLPPTGAVPYGLPPVEGLRGLPTYTGVGGYQGYREDFDEDRARDEARSELRYQSYRGMYGPYGCTRDCSGHEAGWQYQADDPYGLGYGGNSESFRDGRRAYDHAVNERVEEMRQEYDDAQAYGGSYDY